MSESPNDERFELQKLDFTTTLEASFVAAFFGALSKAQKEAEGPDYTKMMNLVLNVITGRDFKPAIPLAPIRTKPRRTYDELTDDFTPEGDHIPVLLARIWEENSPQKSRLSQALVAFAVEASLFKKIGVRRLGARPTDPFQLLITTAGPAANLPDVGYGVSQALPLVVQSILAPRKGRLLLQQPEVHLHPRVAMTRLVGREALRCLVDRALRFIDN